MVPAVARLHSLVARNYKVLKAAWNQTTRLVESAVRTNRTQLNPSYVRNAPHHPIHRIAAIRQSKSRWYQNHRAFHSAIRRFTSATSEQAGSLKYNRASFPKSRAGNAVNSLSGRAPFAHTLRPNLTGGTLGRTAGGYGFGGGSARYFSHGPAAPAQVVHNVSQGIRAFLLSGQKAQYHGVNPQTGEKRYRAVTTLQDNAGQKMKSLPKASPGSHIDFTINPTITALTPLTGVAGFAHQLSPKENINSEGLLDVLSIDFSRSLKELSAVLNDLKRLSTLGDLPITYRGTSLRVHFPGCDSGTVGRLCDELGVSRGLICQDEDFDDFVGTEIALLFPFAPSKTASECSFMQRPVEDRALKPEQIIWEEMISSKSSVSEESEQYSTRLDLGFGFENIEDLSQSPSPSGYESLHSSELETNSYEKHSPLEYQGIEGIYRFMEQCQ